METIKTELSMFVVIGDFIKMADSPDREINFRGARGDNRQEHDFEDANDTLEDQRQGAHGRRDCDVFAAHGRNKDDHGDGNMVPYKLSIHPETYDGTEDWEEYISHFEICAELGRWRDHDKLLALGMALKGPARTFYISLTATERRTYDALLHRLSQRFGSTRQKSRWLNRFESRRRGQGESIAALADDLRQMAQRAYSDLDGTAQEVLALNQMYKNIPPEVKYQCTNQECTTVTDAVEVIERYEAIIGDVTEKKRQGVRMISEASSEGATGSSKMDETINKLTRLVNNLDDRSHNQHHQTNRGYSRPGFNRGNITRPMACHFCGKTNHFIKNCEDYKKCKEEFLAQLSTQSSTRPAESKPRFTQAATMRNQGNFNSPLAQ